MQQRVGGVGRQGEEEAAEEELHVEEDRIHKSSQEF
jgi:hypothetical protein